jgi:hypothetical protein
MKEILKINKFNNRPKIVIYHGLGGEPNQDRIQLLNEKYHIYNILYDHINYEAEWNKDKCKKLCENQINKTKDVDLYIGLSLGGYLAYILSNINNKNVILINPALDRDKSKLDIKWFDIDFNKNNNINIELFLGINDNLINKDITIDYLNKNDIKYKLKFVPNMEHRTSINDFDYILKNSSIKK